MFVLTHIFGILAVAFYLLRAGALIKRVLPAANGFEGQKPAQERSLLPIYGMICHLGFIVSGIFTVTGLTPKESFSLLTLSVPGALTVVALLLTLSWKVLRVRVGHDTLGACVLPVSAICFLVGAILFHQQHEVIQFSVPRLFEVISIVIATVFFALGAVSSLLLIFAEKQLKSCKDEIDFPPITFLNQVSRRAILVGFISLVFVWLSSLHDFRNAWVKSEWLFSLTLLVYAVTVFSKFSRRGLGGTSGSYLSLLGFACFVLVVWVFPTMSVAVAGISPGGYGR